jgi:hypothetical protein
VTPQVLEEHNLSSNNNFPLPRLATFPTMSTWFELTNPKFYYLRVMFSDLSIAVQIPKTASISLEIQLRLFVFHLHLVTGVRFCPFTPSFLGSDALPFSFSFW